MSDIGVRCITISSATFDGQGHDKYCKYPIRMLPLIRFFFKRNITVYHYIHIISQKHILMNSLDGNPLKKCLYPIYESEVIFVSCFQYIPMQI